MIIIKYVPLKLNGFKRNWLKSRILKSGFLPQTASFLFHAFALSKSKRQEKQ